IFIAGVIFLFTDVVFPPHVARDEIPYAPEWLKALAYFILICGSGIQLSVSIIDLIRRHWHMDRIRRWLKMEYLRQWLLKNKIIFETLPAVTALIVTLLIAFFGFRINCTLKDKEIKVKYVEIAAGILRDKNMDTNNKPIRDWAIDVLYKC